MIDNVGRKLVLIGVLLGAALLLLLIPERPVRMGLDIAGGTRMVYKLDFEDARKKGAISPDETNAEVLNQTISIIRERVDPTGVYEPVIRRSGEDLIEIQLPGIVGLGSGGTKPVPLESDVAASGSGIIRLAGDATALSGYPGGGGTVRIGSEDIRYGRRVNNELQDIERAVEGTTMGPHSSGEPVLLVSDDSIKNAIENLGDLRFYPVADDQAIQSLGTDSSAENAKLQAWLARPENAETPIAVYNALSPNEGGAPDGLLWFPMQRDEAAGDLPRDQWTYLPVMETPEEWTFSGADLERVFKTQDRLGYPAVGFEMTSQAAPAFGDFTKQYIKKQLAIALNDEIVTAPELEGALYGQSQITGGINGFTDREVREMVTVLRSGSLQVKPELQESEKVGATLGADYVRRGFLGGMVALLLTFLFMSFYYRKLGLFACAALAANLILLMGVMVIMQATLTLPGIAGIILTVGMAVDANILIFDRIREEAEKGRKPIQAAKDGFANALSAIIDANVTTFLTAAILKYVGTGPIRGFATTLMIGIATSMFAALVITRVLVHLQTEKGVEKWSMSRWMADAKYDFFKFSKVALMGSAVAVLAGVALFLITPDNQKLGIDFLGGARVKVRTENAMPVDEVRALVAQIPGNIGSTAEVTALPVSEGPPDSYREFAVTFKTPPGSNSDGATIFESEIRNGLAEVIQRGPVDASISGADADRTANLVLYFEDDHPVEDVRSVLAGIGLTDIDVSNYNELDNVFKASGQAQAGTDDATLRALVQSSFTGEKDSSGSRFVFAQPMPETSVIGATVVGELRDSAIRAILLSIFLVVMYIRVRFAEYSYGFAAVAAVVHDVLITLGAVALMVKAPFIQVEVNLTLIAAFLTILGYSLNDTIVIFDRVRENLPREKGSLKEIVNLSINQTLSRTVVTSVTTLLSILVVLAFNFGTGNVLEGFMFALAVGVLSGTYSTIFIACPLLVWFENRAMAKGDGGGKVVAARKPATST